MARRILVGVCVQLFYYYPHPYMSLMTLVRYIYIYKYIGEAQRSIVHSRPMSETLGVQKERNLSGAESKRLERWAARNGLVPKWARREARLERRAAPNASGAQLERRGMRAARNGSGWK